MLMMAFIQLLLLLIHCCTLNDARFVPQNEVRFRRWCYFCGAVVLCGLIRTNECVDYAVQYYRNIYIWWENRQQGTKHIYPQLVWKLNPSYCYSCISNDIFDSFFYFINIPFQTRTWTKLTMANKIEAPLEDVDYYQWKVKML